VGHLADAHFGRRAGENDVSGEQPRAFGEAGDDLGNREHHVRGVALLDLFAVDSSARFDAVRVLELVRDDQERAGRTEAGKGLSNCFSRIGAAAGTFILPMSVDSLGAGTTMLHRCRHLRARCCDLAVHGAGDQGTEPERVAAKLPEKLESYTPQTITSRKALVKELHQIREQGYAILDDELEEGLFVVACPSATPPIHWWAYSRSTDVRRASTDYGPSPRQPWFPPEL